MTYLQMFKKFNKNLSAGTIRNYTVHITRLDSILNNMQVDNDRLTKEMNILIIKSNKGDSKSAGTLRGAFLYLLKILDVSAADFLLVKSKNKERRILKKWLTFDTIRKIVDNCDDQQLKIIIMLQYETCSRIGDILQLTPLNIDFEDNIVRMTTQKTGISKANAITETTANMIKSYIEKRSIKAVDKIFDKRYWLVWFEQKILLRKLYNMVGADAFNFSSHWLRSSRAVHLYKSGIDLETIKREGGWKSVEVLMKYLTMSGIDSKKTLEQVKPKW